MSLLVELIPSGQFRISDHVGKNIFVGTSDKENSTIFYFLKIERYLFRFYFEKPTFLFLRYVFEVKYEWDWALVNVASLPRVDYRDDPFPHPSTRAYQETKNYSFTLKVSFGRSELARQTLKLDFPLLSEL